jgi:DNA-binding MarR family transcriptional regulator
LNDLDLVYGITRSPEAQLRASEIAFTSCYDINMRAADLSQETPPLLRTLADFRYQLRSFLCFSEQAANGAGLQPQQHQLLLQVAGAPDHTEVTIAYAAARLGIKHNSAVELVSRSEREGLLTRVVDVHDKRRMLLRITRKGTAILNRLTSEHARELNVMAPRLIEALERVRAHADLPARVEAE